MSTEATSKYLVDFLESDDNGGNATTRRWRSRPVTQFAATTATYCETAAPEQMTLSALLLLVLVRRFWTVNFMVQGNSDSANVVDAKWRMPQTRWPCDDVDDDAVVVVEFDVVGKRRCEEQKEWISDGRHFVTQNVY